MTYIKCLKFIIALFFVECFLFSCKPAKCQVCSFGEWEVVKEATCNEQGQRIRLCTVCGSIQTEMLVATNHGLKEYHSVDTQTHSAVCEHCGLECIDYHDMTVKEILCEPTHLTHGSQILQCATCGFENTLLTQQIAEHSFKDFVLVSEPTCKDYGIIERSCECGFVELINVEKYPHTPVKIDGITPSCTENGLTESVKCSVCEGVVIPADIIPAKGHNMVVLSSKKAKCSSAGSIVYGCAEIECLFSKAVTLPATGHLRLGEEIFVSESKLGANTSCRYERVYKRYCYDCMEYAFKIEVVEKHAYSVNVESTATCVSAGTKKYTCLVCGNESRQSYTDSQAHSFLQASKNGDIITYHCQNNSCNAVKTCMDAQGSETATVDTKKLDGNSLLMKYAEISFDSSALMNLGNRATVSVSIIDDVTLCEFAQTILESIGQATVYKLSVSSGASNVYGLAQGLVRVSFDYTVGDNADKERLAVLVIDKNGEVSLVRASFYEGKATFSTNVIGYYVVVDVSLEECCEIYGHDNEILNVTRTCTEYGYSRAVCRRCKEVSTLSVEAVLGHYYSVTLISASCNSFGVTIYDCKNCDAHYEVLTNATGHDYTVSVVDAECGKTGYTLTECNVCGATYKTNVVYSCHELSAEVTQPTCGDYGKLRYECKNCTFAAEEKLTPSGNHEWYEGACKNCKKVKDKGGF